MFGPEQFGDGSGKRAIENRENPVQTGRLTLVKCCQTAIIYTCKKIKIHLLSLSSTPGKQARAQEEISAAVKVNGCVKVAGEKA